MCIQREELTDQLLTIGETRSTLTLGNLREHCEVSLVQESQYTALLPHNFVGVAVCGFPAAQLRRS